MLKSITIFLVGANLLFSCSETPSSQESYNTTSQDTLKTSLNNIDTNEGWQEIDFNSQNIIQKLAYADSSNFIGHKIYPCAKCFLRPEAAQALLKANEIIKKLDLRIVLFDCYRPTLYQQVMFDIVKDSKYVAEPKQGGSMHNKGLAVDIAFANKDGSLLEFGGEFDDFSEKSHHSYTNLSPKAIANRQLLKKTMIKAGFEPYKYEWWHYSYKKVNYSLDDFIWDCD